MIRLDLTWVSQMAKLGALECLNDYAGFDDISAGIMPGSMSTTLYKGQNYGLPLNANTTVAVYNNAVLQEYGFDAPPETLDALMGALDKTNPAEEKWLFAVSGSYNWAMLPFIWTLGGSVTDGDYTTASGYLNGADTVKALDTIVGWYKDGVIGPAIMGEQPDGWGGIEAGNYTMIVEGPWFFSSEDKLDTYTPALMPSVDGRSISIVGGEDIVMTSTSSKKDAAWTFMKFMLEDAQQVAMAGAGMIPVTSSAMEKVDTSGSPYVEVYMEQLKTAQARIPCSSWPTIETILNTAFESVLRGRRPLRRRWMTRQRRSTRCWHRNDLRFREGCYSPSRKKSGESRCSDADGKKKIASRPAAVDAGIAVSAGRFCADGAFCALSAGSEYLDQLYRL